MLQQFKRWAHKCARDEGVAGVVIAMIISIAAFSALAVFMSKNGGLTRELPRTEASYSSIGLLESAVLLQVNQNATLPCPDTDADPDGVADACNGSGTTSGVLPWITLGLGKNDVVDGYGTFYTYVVAAAPKDLCVSVGNDFDGSADPEYTGEIISSQELELRTTDQDAGDGRYVPFAIISHGANKLGGISIGGTAYSAPVSGSDEETNAGATPTVVFSGPRDTGSGTDYFDDIAFAPTAEELQDVCEDNTPAGQANADLYEPFVGAIDPDKLETSAGGGAPTYTTDASGNGVAQLTLTSSYLLSAVDFRFATFERPIYISTLWTPDPLSTGAATAGFSIITRSDGTPTGDLDDPGITFRFGGGAIDDDADGEPGNIDILNDGATVTPVTSAGSGTFDLITAETYRLEVYDDGAGVWMRIAQVDDPANYAWAYATALTVDYTGTRVAFVNGVNGTSYLDDVLVGVPMLAVDTYGTGYVETDNNENGTTTGDITLEAWVKPRSLPTGVNEATILSQWNATGLNNSSYRLYMTDGGALSMSFNDVNDATDTEVLNASLSVGEWTHIAVTYETGTGTLRTYLNGSRVSSLTGVLAGEDIHGDNTPFRVGAHFSGGAAVSIFDGAVADLRIWETVRTSAEISSGYKHRLPLVATSPTTDGLVVNWRFDLESGGIASAVSEDYPTSLGDDGDLLSGAQYIAAQRVDFRQISTEICGPDVPAMSGVGGRVGAYRCDFRDAAGLQTLEASTFGGLATVYAKAWAGGGGADLTAPPNHGGGGGFAGGLFLNTGLNIRVTVGDGGTSAANPTDGDDSLVERNTTDMVEANFGNEGANTADGAAGTGQTNASVLTSSTATGNGRRPGCIPAIAVVGDACDDPHYVTTGAPVDLPGYGGDGDAVGTLLEGQAGVVVLLW